MPIGTKEVDDNVRDAAKYAGVTPDAEKQGYAKADAFDPQPKPRNPYVPGNMRLTGEADTDEVKKRASQGAVIDMSVFNKK